MNMSVLCVLSDMTRGGSCGGGGGVRGVWWGQGGASGSSRGFRLQSRRIVHYAAVPSGFFFLSFPFFPSPPLACSLRDDDKQSGGTSCRASLLAQGPARRLHGLMRDKPRRRHLALARMEVENMTHGGTSVNDLPLTLRQRRRRRQRGYGGVRQK